MTDQEAFANITRELRKALCREFKGVTVNNDALLRLNEMCQSALKGIQQQGYFHDFKVRVRVDPTDSQKLLVDFTPPANWIPIKFVVTDKPCLCRRFNNDVPDPENTHHTLDHCGYGFCSKCCPDWPA